MPKQRGDRLLQSDYHIGIVGSGIAGLASALAIIRAKNNVHVGDDDCENNVNRHYPSSSFHGKITIYERDSCQNERKEGYGMTLTYDPVGPLAKLGILEDVAQKDCPSRCHYTFDESGCIRGYFGNAFNGDGGWGQRGNIRIPRSGLRSILMDALMVEADNLSSAAMSKNSETEDLNDGSNDPSLSPPVVVLWNKRLTSYVDGPMMEKLNAIGSRKRGNDVDDGEDETKEELEDISSPVDRHRPVILQFDDGTSDRVDLLIGADGVHSSVARQYLSTAVPPTMKASDVARSLAVGESTAVDISSPRDLDVFIILGISDYFHPTVDERGYYTLDGTHRLFVMPFEGSKLDDLDFDDDNIDGVEATNKPRRRTMWQLSFPVPDRNEALHLRQKSNSEEMRQEVLRRCGHFHEPFPDMVRSTPISTIWGTSLLDRDPDDLLRHQASLEVHGRLPSRVVLVGDAVHPMTPFKGQGCNQALADAVLLAKWLSNARIESAIRSYMTEMARRSGVKVRASRDAANALHSENCWQWLIEQEQKRDECLPFHGVQAQHVPLLLHTLKDRGVGAHTVELDNVIRCIIRELSIVELNSSGDPNKITSQQQQQHQHTLEYASSGNMSRLRQLSRKCPTIIPTALESNTQRRCLHLAAMNNHVQVCRWLLSEVNVDVDALDAGGNKAVDLAVDEETICLLTRWRSRRKR
jgi:2-polyprenyl-6-methoxyphenol hydroxylase-like FAD-dependent oxidoreductase